MSDRPVAIITGAGGGLGTALVKEFTAQQWRVAVCLHKPAASGPREHVLHLQVDVTSKSSVTDATDRVLAIWGRIDALVNNAGIADDRSTWDMTNESWQQVLNVNLKGAFLCSQAVVRAMIKQRDGHIINISSSSGRAGRRGQANYAAAKAGLFGLTASLARELGSRNVRVNAVLPGVLPTQMTAACAPAIMEHFAAANALGRINSVDEVARFIVFLARTQNISGQLFQLDSRIAPWT